MKFHRSFKLKLMVSVFLVAVMVPGIIIWRIYDRGKRMQIESLRMELITMASVVARQIDGNDHDALPCDASAFVLPEYRKVDALLRYVRETNPLFNAVYTIRPADLSGTGVIVFSTENRDEIGKRYDYSRFPEFVRGFSDPSADRDLTEDEEGVTLSGYAPIRDQNGKVVAALGIDIRGESVLELRRELRVIAIANIFASMILAWGLAFLASRWLSKPVDAITGAMAQLASGDMEARANIKSGDEFERMGEQFNAMAAGLREREKMKVSLAAAREIQQSLIPREIPEMAGLDAAGLSDYCDETGGDYYDFWHVTENGPLAVVLGDVSGHGVGSALLMAAVRRDLRSLAPTLSDDPAGFLGKVNDHLAADVPPGKFITLFLGMIDPATLAVKWASAGHDSGVVFHPGANRFTELSPTGMPLGIMEGAEFGAGSGFKFEKSDLLVVGTDGIWEARNSTGEFYGQERYRESIRCLAGLSAREICRGIVEAVHRFRGSSEQLDDITIIVIKAA